MQKKKLKFFIILVIFNSYLASSQEVSFEFHGGWATNTKSPLIIKQKGFKDIYLIAKYYSEPFVSPIYWLWRFTFLKNKNNAWSFEAVHHKLYLKNSHPDIQRFGISHGLNLLIINKVFITNKRFHFNIGAGTVLAHPESTIRNMPLQEHGKGILGLGYYLSGIVLNISAGKYFYLTKKFYLHFEARFNPSYSVVPIYNGKSLVPNFAFQIIGGLGYVFLNKK